MHLRRLRLPQPQAQYQCQHDQSQQHVANAAQCRVEAFDVRLVDQHFGRLAGFGDACSQFRRQFAATAGGAGGMDGRQQPLEPLFQLQAGTLIVRWITSISSYAV